MNNYIVPTLSFSVLRKTAKGEPAPISKTINIVDGKVKTNADDCWLAEGMVTRITGSDLSTMVNVMAKLRPQHAMCLGSPMKNGELVDQAPLTTVRRQAEGKAPDDAISRSKENFEFTRGVGGLLLVDFDDKAMPDHVADLLTSLGGIDGALHDIAPALQTASHITRASTSAAVINDATGDLIGTGAGCHKYFHVLDQADIPRATQALHQRAWLAGLGWFMISKSGAILERSIVDVTVASPERIIFEAPPVLGEGLTYKAEMRGVDVVEGKVLDTMAVIPSLTARERAEYDAILAAARQYIKPEAERIRDEYITARAHEMVRTHNVPFSVALDRLEHTRNNVLTAEMEMHLDELGVVTLGDILADPGKYIGHTLGDPLEPDYGRCKAKIMATSKFDDVPFINSQAHGIQTIYHLGHNQATLQKEFDRVAAGKQKITASGVDRLAYLIATSTLRDTAEADAIDWVIDNCKRRGVTHRTLRTTIKKFRKEARASVAAGDADVDRRDDPRPKIEIKGHDAPVLETMYKIDAALASIEDQDPPVRHMSGNYMIDTYEEVRRVGVSAEDEDPEMTRVRSLELAGGANVGVDLECFLRFVAPATELKPERNVQCPVSLGEAYKDWAGSTLPRVSGVASLPIVTKGSTLQTTNGLNRDLQVVLSSPQSVLNALPDPDAVTLDDAGAAYKWLLENWLVDVETDDAGLGATIAICAQAIQRHTLAEAPGYFIRAPQRGGGKSTLANMVSRIVTGNDAPATAWSDRPEERKKLIFSLLLKDRPLIVFDNIANGSTITDETINAMMTLPTLSDRVLGFSKAVEVPTTSVVVFTGNNIAPKSDMASRFFNITLTPNREDPENRTFTHSNIIAWTTGHRSLILSKIYTILLARPLDHGDRKGGGGTRFVDWYQTIGRRIEAAAIKADRPFTFREMAKSSEDENEERGAMQVLFELLHERADSKGRFTTSDMAGWMTHPEQPFSPGGFDGKSVAQEVWEEKCAVADEIREAFNEVAQGRAPITMRGVTKRRVGTKMRAIIGRHAEINVDGETRNLKLEKDEARSTAREASWVLKQVDLT